jgi:hypothetical protein
MNGFLMIFLTPDRQPAGPVTAAYSWRFAVAADTPQANFSPAADERLAAWQRERFGNVYA